MAWWDYGYQINGMANRTTIADGNTWNHEHIALLGKALVSPTSEGHKIAKHLADYVLVWSTRFGGMQVFTCRKRKRRAVVFLSIELKGVT
jgi:dolichyl-diphosphooligosaccharide--protein glycosyltransferase